jgi:hypothetical protein
MTTWNATVVEVSQRGDSDEWKAVVKLDDGRTVGTPYVRVAADDQPPKVGDRAYVLEFRHGPGGPAEWRLQEWGK